MQRPAEAPAEVLVWHRFEWGLEWQALSPHFAPPVENLGEKLGEAGMPLGSG